jgi:hypothetical protein
MEALSVWQLGVAQLGQFWSRRPNMRRLRTDYIFAAPHHISDFADVFQKAQTIA